MENLSLVIETADAILMKINTDALATFFGTRPATDTEELKEVKKTKEGEKKVLVDALHRKSRAQGDSTHSENSGDTMVVTYKELIKWANGDKESLAPAGIQYDMHTKKYGLALEVPTLCLFKISIIN